MNDVTYPFTHFQRTKFTWKQSHLHRHHGIVSIENEIVTVSLLEKIALNFGKF